MREREREVWLGVGTSNTAGTLGSQQPTNAVGLNALAYKGKYFTGHINYVNY